MAKSRRASNRAHLELMAFSFRFSIGKLLLATVAVAIVCWWNAAWFRQEMLRRELESRAAQLGGRIGHFRESTQTWTDIWFENVSLTDEQLANFPWPQRVSQIHLENSGAGDKTLEKIGQIQNLRFLDLAGTKVTDQGIEHLRAAPLLECLSLSACPITDKSVKHLKTMPKLDTIYLDHTLITGKNFQELTSHPKLWYIEIGRCPNLDMTVVDQLSKQNRHWNLLYDWPGRISIVTPRPLPQLPPTP